MPQTPPALRRPLAILDRVETAARQDQPQLDEDRAVREGCGLLDRSERGKLAFSGDGAKTFLQGQVTNDVEALAPGRGCYAAVLSPKGKMLGDLRILDAGEELLLDTERGALQAIFNVLHRARLGFDAELHKRTLQRGLLSLAGPGARRVVGAEAQALPEEEHAHGPVEIDGIAARAIVTDVGVDLLCDAEDTEALAAALRARGAEPVPRPPSRRCASSAGARASASTSTRRRSPRRPGSTSARSPSRRAATSARRRSRASITRASPTATCAGCGCRRPSRPARS